MARRSLTRYTLADYLELELRREGKPVRLLTLAALLQLRGVLDSKDPVAAIVMAFKRDPKKFKRVGPGLWALRGSYGSR